ncbi:hypothetical protein [Streptomyces sp. NPDC090022]
MNTIVMSTAPVVEAMAVDNPHRSNRSRAAATQRNPDTAAPVG